MLSQDANKYGYCRCSTDDTKQDIKRQVYEVKEMGAEIVFTEYESGTKRDRQELDKLLSIIGPNDVIYTTEVSRLSRSMKDLLDILEICKNKRVKIIIGSFVLDFTKDLTDPMVMAMVQIMGVFSQMERDIIAGRVKSGLENAKRKGVKLGRPKITKDNIPALFLRYYIQYKQGQINVTELTRLSNIKARSTTYRYIKILEAAE